MSMPKMKILNISRLNIIFTKRRHLTSECLSAFPYGKHYLKPTQYWCIPKRCLYVNHTIETAQTLNYQLIKQSPQYLLTVPNVISLWMMRVLPNKKQNTQTLTYTQKEVANQSCDITPNENQHTQTLTNTQTESAN